MNLDLAKKAPGCLNYIVLHELVHLLERHHDDRFVALMDRHMPDWRHRRQVLNEAPSLMRTGRTVSELEDSADGAHRPTY